MSRINYVVPGPVTVLRQPSSNTCWAAVGAMMVNWRKRTRGSIADVMSTLGPRWSAQFRMNQGMAPAQVVPFARACGMRTEPLMCTPLSTWLAMLRRHGLLAVVTVNPTAFHARIMRGIAEPGTRPGRTYVMLLDPANGRQYGLDFGRFTQRFEAGAFSPRPQVWHY